MACEITITTTNSFGGRSSTGETVHSLEELLDEVRAIWEDFEEKRGTYMDIIIDTDGI